MSRGPLNFALMVAAFALATVVALVLGASNTGNALAFGQLAFAAVLVWVLLRR